MMGFAFERAEKKHCERVLHIIHRCLREVNSKDYSAAEIKRQLEKFNPDWFLHTIENSHYYVVTYGETIIGAGGVGRDLINEKQCCFRAVFVDPDYEGKGVGKQLIRFLENDEWCRDSNLIEIAASFSAHGFYSGLGYQYRDNPPILERDGVVMMYRYQGEHDTNH